MQLGYLWGSFTIRLGQCSPLLSITFLLSHSRHVNKSDARINSVLLTTGADLKKLSSALANAGSCESDFTCSTLSSDRGSPRLMDMCPLSAWQEAHCQVAVTIDLGKKKGNVLFYKYRRDKPCDNSDRVDQIKDATANRLTIVFQAELRVECRAEDPISYRRINKLANQEENIQQRNSLEGSLSFRQSALCSVSPTYRSRHVNALGTWLRKKIKNGHSLVYVKNSDVVRSGGGKKAYGKTNDGEADEYKIQGHILTSLERSIKNNTAMMNAKRLQPRCTSFEKLDLFISKDAIRTSSTGSFRLSSTPRQGWAEKQPTLGYKLLPFRYSTKTSLLFAILPKNTSQLGNFAHSTTESSMIHCGHGARSNGSAEDRLIDLGEVDKQVAETTKSIHLCRWERTRLCYDEAKV
ncbi:hypothetical protein Tco_0368738 [Tanacetum coccineum]